MAFFITYYFYCWFIHYFH